MVITGTVITSAAVKANRRRVLVCLDAVFMAHPLVTLFCAGRKPLLDVRPSGFLGAAAGHDADVAAADTEQLFILAADPGHHPLRLARRRDVVILSDDIEDVRRQFAQLDALPTEHQRALYEAIRL